MAGHRSAQPFVLIACATGLAVSYSAVFLVTFSAFMAPIANDLGWSRGRLSVLLSIGSVSLALATPIVGSILARVGVRRVLLAAVLSFGASLALLSVCPPSYPAFLVLAVLIGVTGAGTNTFVYLSVLPRWFSDRLGLALGIAMSGIGVGQAAFPIVAQWLIEIVGWRDAYLCLAIISIVVSTPGILLILGRAPPVAAARDRASGLANNGGIGRETAMRTTAFWLLLFAFFAIAVTASACAIHAVPMLVDRGLTPMMAASYGAAGGISVLVGRLGAGFLLDIVGPRAVGLTAFACAAIAPCMYVVDVPVQLLIAAPVLLGFAIGVEGDLMPYVVKRLFGLRDYEFIYSRMFTGFTAGVVIGPAVMGVGHDRFGTYAGLLAAFSILSAVAMIALFVGLKANPVDTRVILPIVP